MSDQCLQFKKDYEKLLELKQEFDVLLKEGESKKDFTEAKYFRDEIVAGMDEIEEDLFETKSWRQLREIFAFRRRLQPKETIEDFLRDCKVDRKNRVVEIQRDLKLPLFDGEIPDLAVKGKLNFNSTRIKKIGGLSAAVINLNQSEIEEIRGNIKSSSDISCFGAEKLTKISGNLICGRTIDLQSTKNLEEITGTISCHDLYLSGSSLKSLPDKISIIDVFLNNSNRELLASAKKCKAEGKILGAIVVI